MFQSRDGGRGADKAAPPAAERGGRHPLPPTDGEGTAAVLVSETLQKTLIRPLVCTIFFSKCKIIFLNWCWKSCFCYNFLKNVKESFILLPACCLVFHVPVLSRSEKISLDRCTRWRLHACHELRCGAGRFWSAPAPGVKVTFRIVEFAHPGLVKYY